MDIIKRNIMLSDVTERLDYSAQSKRVSISFPARERKGHAQFIAQKLEECRRTSLSQKQVAAIHYRDGMYLEFSGKAGYDLLTKGLENQKQGIRLLNVQRESADSPIKATVYVPAGKENYFIKKVNEYADKETQKGNPKNQDLIASIEDVRNAVLESFWLDKHRSVPGNGPEACEIWLRYEVRNGNNSGWQAVEESFVEQCIKSEIKIDSKRVLFPERLVKMIYANANQLKMLIDTCDYIAEIHHASEPNSFFEDLRVDEQRDWANELLGRVQQVDTNTVICLLDEGITQDNPLIRPMISDDHVLAYDAAWGTRDNNGIQPGHGTEMAGISLYNDLNEALSSVSPIVVGHKLESVKILPPVGSNPKDLYGAITQASVNLAEIANPNVNRVVCMAVTSHDEEYDDGRPSSWSAALDKIASGSEEEDIKRLFLVSAGNLYPSELEKAPYPDANILYGVDDPGQSWNAITVGAYSDDKLITSSCFVGFSPLVNPDALSPYSSTSKTWATKWPIKPEILFNGGNMMTNGSDVDSCPDLALLTTGHRINSNLFSVIWGTSSATAQASYFAARIYEEYPEIWPETVRALMIHSAEWTEEMKRTFLTNDTKRGGRRMLLRTCGYGIPNLNSAIQCMNNSVNMVIQGEIQPFSKDSMHEMHFHTLPWPKDVLESLGDTIVKLKVTLSYYIDPAPGEIGWKDRYRYPSCGLRFDVNNYNQTADDFKRAINVRMREDDRTDRGEGTSGSSRWFLGSENRDVGSIHSDFIECSAVDLCDCNFIAVYPVVGWWRERKNLMCYDKKIRYSLVVSLSTPDTSVDLYTPIMVKVESPIVISN